MSQESNSEKDMRPEYDFSGGVRGKYYERHKRWTSITSASSASTAPVSEVSTGTRSTGKITTVVSCPMPHLSSNFSTRAEPRGAIIGANAG